MPQGGSRDLSKGVIVVLSGGPFDFFNPLEVRNRMDELIFQVNQDEFVLDNTNRQGLTFKLLPSPDQEFNHIHHSQWPKVSEKLKSLNPSPLILIGHSNGGAAVIDLARSLKDDVAVDLAITADSVLTLNDRGGDVNQVPSNVRLNLNPYVIPTFAWILGPFPYGQPNTREDGRSLDGILNIGLPFEQAGFLAHRNAFYDLAGGDELPLRLQFPEMLLDMTLDVLKGQSNDDVFLAAQTDLQVLANKARIAIELESTTINKTLEPQPLVGDDRAATSRLAQSTIDEVRGLMNKVEHQCLSAF